MNPYLTLGRQDLIDLIEQKEEEILHGKERLEKAVAEADKAEYDFLERFEKLALNQQRVCDDMRAKFYEREKELKVELTRRDRTINMLKAEKIELSKRSWISSVVQNRGKTRT